MIRHMLYSSASFLIATRLFIAVATAAEQDNWPAFRGAAATGVASGYQTPQTWDAGDPSDKSILWKVPVPGLGHSCPTIVGDRLFLATAVAEDQRVELNVGRNGDTKAAHDVGKQTWMVLCFDTKTGRELWKSIATEGIPKATRHPKATHANTTVAVEGDNVVAFFGSEGLYCFDLDGNLRWKKDLGVIDVSKYGIGWGYASSPAIHEDKIVLVCDAPDNPFVIALKLSDGQELWRRSRKDECERSWGTPFIHATSESSQVVINGWPWIVSYDLASGDERWRIRGGGDNPIPTPFVAKDRFFVTNSHGGKSPIYSIRTDAKGDISESTAEPNPVAWKTERGGSYMSTPIVFDDYLYLGDTSGVFRCFDAATGEKIYEKRLDGGAYVVASLVAADNKIYCTAEDGTIFVVRAGKEYELLARNRMGEPCHATPAISKGVLYVRTAKSLVAIGGNPGEATDVPSNTSSESGDLAKPKSSEPSANLPTKAATSTTKTTQKPANILFIAVDDLRPDSIGCYGDARAVTPNIDRLAKQGMLFNRAYCQVAVCNPSRATLMTGLRPDTLGVWTLPIHFREAMPNAVTMPQWFRKHGYTAVGHGKIFHNPTPDPQSWSQPIHDVKDLPYFYPEGTREEVARVEKSLPANNWRKNNLRGPSTGAPDLPDNRLLDGAQTDLAIEDLKRLGKSHQPFFLAMGFIRPHLAFVAPKKYWDLHDPKNLPVLLDQAITPDTPAYALHNNSELSHYVDLIDMPKPTDDRTLSEEKMRQMVHGYYACVSYVDAQIGRLLDALEAEGLRESTIVVLWSDHGWKLGEYRSWGKMTNYEIDTRVPLIIAAPGLPTVGRRTERLAELLDLYPTLCELTNIPTPAFVEGRSLKPTLLDPHAKVRDEAMSQYYRKQDGIEVMGYSMRTERYRLIEWRDFATGEAVAHELYEHQTTGLETNNLAKTAPLALLDSLKRQLSASHPPKKLVMTPAVHSSPSSGRWPAKLSFQNDTETEILIHAITQQGSRGNVRKLAPGKSLQIDARIGGAYVVESVDGSIHEIHSPSWPEHSVTIRK